jgi:hypothetical protein
MQVGLLRWYSYSTIELGSGYRVETIVPDETYLGAESVFSVANLAADHYPSHWLLSYRAHLWRLLRTEIPTPTFHAELRRTSMSFDATLRVLDLA